MSKGLRRQHGWGWTVLSHLRFVTFLHVSAINLTGEGEEEQEARDGDTGERQHIVTD